MSNIWLSSDAHFGHKNITGPLVSRWKDGYRNFNSTYYMNQVLTETYNKYIKEDDILWYLGDFSFGGHLDIPIYRSYINCKTIHFILGNHDKHLPKYAHLFSSVQEKWKGEIDGKKVFFNHYPIPNWEGKKTGVYHAYGHVHGNLSEERNGNSIDIGVDHAYKLFGEYRPFALEEFISILDERNS